MNALQVNGSRILSPAEAATIRSVIRKPSNRALFDLLLYTGLRFVEIRQLAETPEIYDRERRLLSIRSGKSRATQKYRNVILCNKGVVAVERYLQNPKLPASSSAWQTNLIRWCRQAGVSELPGRRGSNPYGITVRTSRKTLESWLLSAYPNKISWVALSQGHTESVSLRHYLTAGFTNGEREAIRGEVKGWGV